MSVRPILVDLLEFRDLVPKSPGENDAGIHSDLLVWNTLRRVPCFPIAFAATSTSLPRFHSHTKEVEATPPAPPL
jgi:hypothetical protein